MSYFDTFIDYSWMLLFIPLPYFYYLFSNLIKIKKEKQKRREREEELRRKKPYLYEPVISEEEKYLDIEIDKEDIPKYKKRIEELVMKLCEKRQTVSISSVEAMLLVELYSDSVVITDNGEFVIDIKTAKKFSRNIMNDPRKFIRYIKSVEKKVDIGNKKNKVELKEVLYLLRNARKFGLYIEDKKEDDLIFKVTSAIHDNEYNDVVVKIVDELQNENEDENFAPQKSQIILQNIANQNEKNIQPSNLESNENVESFEKLENGKIEIKLKNGTVITKDDLMIYDVETPKEEEDNKKNNKENESKKDYNKLTEENNEEDNEIEEYKSLFGELTGFEKKHIDKKLFKYRARWFFDMQLYGIREFNYEQFKTDNIFDKKNIFIYFLAQIFNEEHAIKNNIPYVFMGDIKLRNKDPKRFITISIHYLLVNLYLFVNRDNKESFFKFCYNGTKININNVNILLANINKEYPIFFPDGNNFLFDAIYTYNTQTIKTLIVRIKIEYFSELLNLQEKEVLNPNYQKLKEAIYGKVNTKAFGQNAKKEKADVVLDTLSRFRECFTKYLN